MGRKYLKIVSSLAILAITNGCSQSSEEETPASIVAAAGKSLYIASGQCNSGLGITTYTGLTSSRLLSKVDLSTGALSYLLDLSSPYQGGNLAPETSPQALVDDGDNILMLTENAVNTGDRKVFSIPKSSPFNMSVYANDVNALTSTAGHITRSLVKDADGSLLFSKSVSIEKLGTNTLRIPMGAASWINAPAGNCATSTTLMSTMVTLPPFSPATSGKILFAHNAAVTANNRIAIVSQDGYSVAGNCIAGVQVTGVAHSYATNITGPAITFPAVQGVNVTAMVYIPTGTGTGKLITAYSAAINTELNNNTNQNYAIVMWDITESSTTAATITNPVILYRDFSIIFGVSAMAYDASTGHLYVASASQPGVAIQTTAGYGYKVEKFLLDITTPTLTLVQVDNKPFLNRSSATKCISSMIVAD